ncbi:MAG: polysulfide reductase NrfD [Rhodothermales bacterium]|nr:polysulfide reductase NrfD [Rhodothermales bacterium]
MNYGFLIRNDRCIGCHACSTACKSENEVPLGVNRTWVKSVETGAYPNVRRHFQVTRCNHCSNPPCVRICPVTAMYQRDDGIVEFDGEACIGCKACLQACPYDAIYVDPDSGTAAKCHYCAHRVEINLEPACVVVCPEHAIIAGDLDDPLSEISKMIASNEVTVRKPEQGTAPKLFYVEGNDANLTPTATSAPETYAWADSLEPVDRVGGDGAHSTQGLPDLGPVMIGKGVMAEQMVQPTYNVQHKMPWHWPVPAYLVTKGIAAGAMIIFAVLFLLNMASAPGVLSLVSGITATVFSAITSALLVVDLERPERFLRILTRPQWKSWLTRGAVILIAFSTLSALWTVYVAGLHLEMWNPLPGIEKPVIAIVLPLAIGAAVYTAFLFGQAEGRDLWQSGLLPVHLLVQAIMVGAASLLMVSAFVDFGSYLTGILKTTLIGSIALDLAIMLFAELAMPHASEVAARASHMITHGRYKRTFWGGAIVVGHILPLILLLTLPVAAFASSTIMLMVVGGLYAYEFAFVMAPQRVPNS